MAETIVYRWIRTMVKPTQGATQNAQNYGNVTKSFWQSAIKHTSQHKQ
jgi:hypothetical protein